MAETEPSTQVIRIRDPQYRDIYANNTQANIGPFDLSILFQKTSEVTPGQMGVVDQVSVTLSPQHFKALVRSLNEMLAAYERVFGELKISDSDTAPQRTATEIAGLINEQRRMKSATMASSTESAPHEKRSRGAVPKKEPSPWP